MKNDEKKIWIQWSIGLLLTIICILVNRFQFRVEQMIKLEFASTSTQMHDYIRTIDSDLQHCYYVLFMNTIWDYGFLVSYSLLTLFSFKIFLDVFQLRIRPWVYILSFITGILDSIENYFLLTTAHLQQEQFSCIYYWAVRIKWAFAIVPVLLILMVIFYGLILLFRIRK